MNKAITSLQHDTDELHGKVKLLKDDMIAIAETMDAQLLTLQYALNQTQIQLTQVTDHIFLLIDKLQICQWKSKDYIW